MVLNNFQRGQVPYFVKPPTDQSNENELNNDLKNEPMIPNQELDVISELEKMDKLSNSEISK